jgi:hypothetical protein
LTDIEIASRRMNFIYDRIQELNKSGRNSEIPGLLASEDLEGILVVNNIAKDEARKPTNKEEIDYYKSLFDKSSEILNTIQTLIEENLIEKVGKQNFMADMESSKKYLGEELFEKAKRLWI